jgi:hypothetical protein
METMSNQPSPLTGFHNLNPVIEHPQTAKALDDTEANIMTLGELRRKLCDLPQVPQKSKWRFW